MDELFLTQRRIYRDLNWQCNKIIWLNAKDRAHFFNPRKPMRLAALQRSGRRVVAGRWRGDENAFGKRARCRAVCVRGTDQPSAGPD